MERKTARLKRTRKTRGRARRCAVHRLCVYRTPRHIYAQIISPDGAATVAAASTLEKSIVSARLGERKEAARRVGTAIAERALAKGIAKVAFDRSGFRYHGRIQALADAARSGGLAF